MAFYLSTFCDCQGVVRIFMCWFHLTKYILKTARQIFCPDQISSFCVWSVIFYYQYLYLYLKSMKLHFLLWLNICNNIFDNISFNNPPFIVHLWRLTHLSCSDRSRIVKLSKNASKYHFLLLHPAQRLSVTTFTLDHFYSINANMVFFTQHSQSDRQQVANFVYILYMVWLYVAPFSGQIWTTNVSDLNLWTN